MATKGTGYGTIAVSRQLWGAVDPPERLGGPLLRGPLPPADHDAGSNRPVRTKRPKEPQRAPNRLPRGDEPLRVDFSGHFVHDRHPRRRRVRSGVIYIELNEHWPLNVVPHGPLNPELDSVHFLDVLAHPDMVDTYLGPRKVKSSELHPDRPGLARVVVTVSNVVPDGDSDGDYSKRESYPLYVSTRHSGVPGYLVGSMTTDKAPSGFFQ